MILTGHEIKREVSNNNITIDPYDKRNLNPNSYNYTLNKNIIEIENLDGKLIKRKILLDEDGYIFKPNRLYLGVTNEKIGSSRYATSLIGRSSIGRLGVHVQLSANLGHTGTCHQWTLEIRVAKQIRIYPNINFGQVSFWKNSGDVDLYDGIYKYINYPHSGFKNKFK